MRSSWHNPFKYLQLPWHHDQLFYDYCAREPRPSYTPSPNTQKHTRTHTHINTCEMTELLFIWRILKSRQVSQSYVVIISLVQLKWKSCFALCFFLGRGGGGGGNHSTAHESWFTWHKEYVTYIFGRCTFCSIPSGSVQVAGCVTLAAPINASFNWDHATRVPCKGNPHPWRGWEGEVNWWGW